MSRTVTIEIPVDEAAAEALRDPDRRASVGRLVSQVARLYQGPDPLAAVLDRTSYIAQKAASRMRRLMPTSLLTMRSAGADRY